MTYNDLGPVERREFAEVCPPRFVTQLHEPHVFEEAIGVTRKWWENTERVFRDRGRGGVRETVNDLEAQISETQSSIGLAEAHHLHKRRLFDTAVLPLLEGRGALPLSELLKEAPELEQLHFELRRAEEEIKRLREHERSLRSQATLVWAVLNRYDSHGDTEPPSWLRSKQASGLALVSGQAIGRVIDQEDGLVKTDLTQFEDLEGRALTHEEVLEQKCGSEILRIGMEGRYFYGRSFDGALEKEPLQWHDGARGYSLDFEKVFSIGAEPHSWANTRHRFEGVGAAPRSWFLYGVTHDDALYRRIETQLRGRYAAGGEVDLQGEAGLRSRLEQVETILAREEPRVVTILQRLRSVLAVWYGESLFRIAVGRSYDECSPDVADRLDSLAVDANELWRRLSSGGDPALLDPYLATLRNRYPECPASLFELQVGGAVAFAARVLQPKLKELLPSEYERLLCEQLLNEAHETALDYRNPQAEAGSSRPAGTEPIADVEEESARADSRSQVQLGEPSRKNDQWGPLLPFLAEAIRRAPGVTGRAELARVFQVVCDEYEDAKKHCAKWDLEPRSMSLDVLGRLRKRVLERKSV